VRQGRTYSIALVGATGIIGREILSILEEREFPVGRLKLFASEKSEGEVLEFHSAEVPVSRLKQGVFKEVDLTFFSAGPTSSQEFAPEAVREGAIVIDTSNAFRMDPFVPLVVPEVNRQALLDHRGIIASPRSSTIQLVLILKPLHDAARIKRIVVSTYQAVSDTGRRGVEELDQQIRDLFNFHDVTIDVFPHQIAFNCLPQCGVPLENDYTEEEVGIANETKKIMGDDRMALTATTATIPVFYGDSESVNIETERKLSAHEVRLLLAQAPGIAVVDHLARVQYPQSLHTVGTDKVFVGRIREDHSVEHGVNLWIAADNLRKGGALNAVQIAEALLLEKL